MRTLADADRLLAAYVGELHAHRYSASMVAVACRILPRLFASLRQARVKDVRAVTEAHLMAFLNELAATRTKRGTPLAVSSLNAYTIVLRRFFAFLDRRGAILSNPAQDLPVRRVDSLPADVISEAKAAKLMSAPPAWTPLGRRDRAILEVLYGTALRLSECARLDLADIDLRSGVLLVRNGKGKKDRVVPIPGRAAKALGDYLAQGRPDAVRNPHEAALFLSCRGSRLSKVAVALLVTTYAQTLGLKVSTHGLRHACATHLLRGGADVRHVQALLGHRFLATTARYTRVAIMDLRRVIARAHPRERKGRPRR